MSFYKLVRLGKDAELAATPSCKAVCKLVCAYDVGWGDNKKTVWVDGSWWGDRATNVVQYLTKGTQVVIHADDIEPEAWQGQNGLSVKLKANITKVELVARPQQEGHATQPQRAAQQPAQQNYAQPSPNASVPNAQSYQPGGFTEFEEDIPM